MSIITQAAMKAAKDLLPTGGDAYQRLEACCDVIASMLKASSVYVGLVSHLRDGNCLVPAEMRIELLRSFCDTLGYLSYSRSMAVRYFATLPTRPFHPSPVSVQNSSALLPEAHVDTDSRQILLVSHTTAASYTEFLIAVTDSFLAEWSQKELLLEALIDPQRYEEVRSHCLWEHSGGQPGTPIDLELLDSAVKQELRNTSRSINLPTSAKPPRKSASDEDRRRHEFAKPLQEIGHTWKEIAERWQQSTGEPIDENAMKQSAYRVNRAATQA